MLKPKTFVGVWKGMETLFTLPTLAIILDVTTDEITQYARNRKLVPAETAILADDLAELHGIKPVLFQQWEKHQGVMVASLPAGWFTWSLNTEPGWLSNSHWNGNPEDLIPCSTETIALARAKNWRY